MNEHVFLFHMSAQMLASGLGLRNPVAVEGTKMPMLNTQRSTKQESAATTDMEVDLMCVRSAVANKLGRGVTKRRGRRNIQKAEQVTRERIWCALLSAAVTAARA